MKYVKYIVLFVLIIALVLGFYYYFTDIKSVSSGDGNVRATKVKEILLRNLDARYPPSPKEVVRFFAEITQVLHNEDYSNQDFDILAEQLYYLYDEELKENNPWDLYLDNLHFDIESYRNQEIVISFFSVANSTDVVYFHEDGFDYARLHCLFTFRKGTNMYVTDHQFLLRKEENGRWKIMAWQKEELPLVD